MTDVVRYTLPFGVFGVAMRAMIVQQDLRRIFDYRQQRIRELFAAGI